MMQSIQYAWLDVGPEGNLTAYERQNESPSKGKVNIRQKKPPNIHFKLRGKTPFSFKIVK